MFHPEVIARRQFAVESRFGESIPGGRLIRRSLDECWAMRARLDTIVDEKGNPTRALTRDEDAFVTHERLLGTIDYRHWSSRWATIAKESQEIGPLTPRWASQEFFLDQIAKLEYERFKSSHPDGLLFNVLKARQLGVSTESECIVAYRSTTQKTVRGLVAGDVKEQSQYLFSMAELVIQHLPWFLKPPEASHQTGDFWTTSTGASIRTAWGRSARGGLQEREKAKGNIGRGRTYGLLHISELSTWERPEQLNDALFPGIPRHPLTFCVCESTAKGRYDWWHHQWMDADRGIGRFTNIFIPWYIEPKKYWLPAPEGWEPLETTKAHAEEVANDSPRWVGRTIHLTKEQLYWYESTRRTYDDSSMGPEFTTDGRRVATFYEEYPASPRDAFQHAGVSLFGQPVLDRLKTQERRPAAVWCVEPAQDIAQLAAWEREQKKRADDAALRESPVPLDVATRR